MEPNEPTQSFRAPIASVWFAWTAPSAGQVQVTTTASDSYPFLSVYTGTSLASLTRIADGSPDFGGESDVTTTVQFAATAGVAYQIQVGEMFSDGGPFALSLQLATARISSVHISAGAINFTISAPPGETVIVEASPDLSNWTSVGTLTVSPSGTVPFSESVNLSAPARCYRFYIQP